MFVVTFLCDTLTYNDIQYVFLDYIDLPLLQEKHQDTLTWLCTALLDLDRLKCFGQTILYPGRFRLPAAIQNSPTW